MSKSSFSTEEFTESLKHQLQKLAFAYKFLQIIVGGVLSIIEGLLIGKVSSEKPPNLLVISLVVIVLIHLVLLYFLVLAEKPLPQFAIEFTQKEQEIEVAKEEINVMGLFANSSRTALIASSLSLVGIDIHFNNNRQLTTEEVFRDILDPWIQSRTDIFWFSEGYALYNIAVYLFNTQLFIYSTRKIMFWKCIFASVTIG